jgi:hypothetical protein
MLWSSAQAVLNAAAVLEFSTVMASRGQATQISPRRFLDTEMTDPNVAELSIGLSDHAASDGDFLALRADVRCRGFSGHTAFVMARRDINLFVADARGLSSKTTDSALFLGGSDKGDQPPLRLQLARAGLSDRFIARIRISTSGPRTDQWNRVETDFISAPAEFNAFLEGLRGLAGSSTPTASLVGDPDDIA